MNKKQLLSIILIAFFIGSVGSILMNRYIIPYVATYPGLSGLNKLVSSSPIVVNRREEVQLNEGVNMIDLVKQSGNVTATILDKDGSYLGNGIVITSDGMILTSEQVINGQKNIQVLLNDGRVFAALVRAADPKSELVVITVDAKNLAVAQFDFASSLRAGQRLFVLGRSNDQYLHKFGTGFVSTSIGNSKAPEVLRSSETFTENLATDISYDPEFVGGSIFNLQGRVVAMMIGNNQYIIAENMQSAVSNFLSSQKIVRPYLGIKYNTKKTPVAGLLVVSTEKGSPADKAGLLANDVIVSIEGQNAAVISFEQVLNNHSAGSMKIVILRSGKNLELNVNLIVK